MPFRDVDSTELADRLGRRIAQVAGTLVALTGVAILVLWLLGTEAYAGGKPGWATMKVNTALCAVLLGLALLLAGQLRRVLLCAAAGLIAGLSLCQYLFSIDLGIDELLLRDPLTEPDAYPGRMSPGTAACFALLALGYGVGPSSWRLPIRFGCAISVLFVSLLAIYVYVYGAHALEPVAVLSTMSLPTALVLALLAGTICSETRGAVDLRRISAHSPGGTALRGLLPIVVFGPLALGGLVIALTRQYDNEPFSIALFAAAVSVFGLAILLWNAELVALLERRRRESEDNVRKAFASSLVPTLLVDTDGLIETSNPIAQRLFGYTAEEFAGLPVDRLVPPNRRIGHAALRDRFAESPAARPMGPDAELYACRKDGSEFPVEIGLNPIPTERGTLIVATILDLSRRHAAERAIRQNERRLSLVAEATNEAIWDYDVETAELWWNPAAERLFGARPDQPSERTMAWWRGRIHADDRERVAASLRDALAGDALNWSATYRFERADGRILHLLDRARIDRNAGGDPLRVVGACLDQTAARRREERLRTSESRARAMVDQAPMLMSILDPDGRVIHVNRAWLRFTGRKAAAAAGDGWLESVHPEEAERIRDELGAAMQRRESLVHQYRLRAESGGFRWVLAHALPWQVDEFGGYIVCGVDIDAMKNSLDELQRSNAELENFAYVASHDLQEPLRMVSSFCQLLERRYADKLDQDGREFIDFAVDGARRMQQLIDDLLQYSRVGRTNTTLEPVDASMAFLRAKRYLEAAIAESGAEIECGPLPVVRSNDVQLTMVFQNLLGNALKFRREDPPRIEISADRDGEGWAFAVRDNGIGIEPEHNERIFRVFQRLHARSSYPGSGIGLSICKKIVENHGGWIRVVSAPGEGSTFLFWLADASAAIPIEAESGGTAEA